MQFEDDVIRFPQYLEESYQAGRRLVEAIDNRSRV
jgi:hypothetical protein